MKNKYLFVDFKNYCPKCKYSSYPEKTDPCCECLEFGANEETRKPINFKEKDSGGKAGKTRT